MEKFKKFNCEEWTDMLGTKKMYDSLVEKVKANLIGKESDFFLSLTQELYKCESPIEQLLYIEMMSMTENLYKSNPYVDIVTIDNQVEIKCGDEKFRVDFLIPVYYINPKDDKAESIFYVVECDGHDFHEKTKEQVAKSNQKTRKLQEYGYQVIRYSGSEIYHHPRKCASNLFRIIFNHFWKKFIKEG